MPKLIELAAIKSAHLRDGDGDCFTLLLLESEDEYFLTDDGVTALVLGSSCGLALWIFGQICAFYEEVDDE